MNNKRKLLLLTPAFIVGYIILEHLLKYYQVIVPVMDVFAAKNHQYNLIFMVTAYFTLLMQFVYLVFVVKNFSNLQNLTVIIVLNFVISVITVNMSITAFNLLLFSTL